MKLIRYPALTRSYPRRFTCYVVDPINSIGNSFAAQASSLLPPQLYLHHSHCLVLAPATLAALPSTRAIPDCDVFYVVDSLNSKLKLVRCPRSLVVTLAALPSMKHKCGSHLIPFASSDDGNDGSRFD